MKVGDLVRHSEFHKLWSIANEWNYEPIFGVGVIVDKNPHKFFVYWLVNANISAQDEEDLELISESR